MLPKPTFLTKSMLMRYLLAARNGCAIPYAALPSSFACADACSRCVSLSLLYLARVLREGRGGEGRGGAGAGGGAQYSALERVQEYADAGVARVRVEGEDGGSFGAGRGAWRGRWVCGVSGTRGGIVRGGIVSGGGGGAVEGAGRANDRLAHVGV